MELDPEMQMAMKAKEKMDDKKEDAGPEQQSSAVEAPSLQSSGVEDPPPPGSMSPDDVGPAYNKAQEQVAQQQKSQTADMDAQSQRSMKM